MPVTPSAAVVPGLGHPFKSLWDIKITARARPHAAGSIVIDAGEGSLGFADFNVFP